MEFVEVLRLPQDTKADCIVKAGQLVTLVRFMYKVLEDLGMSSIPGIPRDPCTTDDVLGW
jgi:hypothetical protein